jgi:hypothetical protein
VDASLIAADANKQRSVSSAEHMDWRLAASRRAVREYLDTLDQAAWGAASETVPKFVSLSDPAAQRTGAHKGRAFFGYAGNYLIDLKAAVILDVEATRAIRQAEVRAAKTMIERTADRFGLKPERLAADTAYGTGKFLGWLIGAGIAPHIPVWDKSQRDDGSLSRGDFVFDPERNTYTCPQGKLLRTTGRVHDGRTLLYRASKRDCEACALKPKCARNSPQRKISRDVNEHARDFARSLTGTEPFDRSRRERKKVEMRFAHLKPHHRFERMRLRGLSGARDEFHLAAIVQNLKTLASRLWRQPPNIPVAYLA